MKYILKIFLVFMTCTAGQLNSYAQNPTDQMDEVQVLAENGKYKKAVKVCNAVIKDDPTFIMAYINKSILLERLDEYVEAIEALSEGLSANKYSAPLYNARALVYMKFAIYDQALRDFDQGIKFAENDTLKYSIMVNKATVKSRNRDFQGAYDILIQCYAFDSTDLPVLNNLAVVCDEVNKSEMTLVYLLKVLEVDSLFVPGFVNIGFHYQSKGEYDKSIAYFDKALELDPYESLSYNNRAYSKLMTGDVDGALEDVNRSIELFSSNAYAFKNRALIYIEMNKTNKVCEDLQHALELNFTAEYGKEVLELQRKHCK